MADILVVKVNMFLKHEKFDSLCNYIRESSKTGVVILPPYCDAQIVPDNIEIQVKNVCEMKGENMNNETTTITLNKIVDCEDKNEKLEKNKPMTYNEIRQAVGLEPIKESNKSFIQDQCAAIYEYMKGSEKC